MGLKSGAVLTIKIRDGADRGYTALREQLEKEQDDAPDATGSADDKEE